MNLYLQMLKLLFDKFIVRKNNGIAIRDFSKKMGVVYIKLAQILATQNYGNLFTEEDRKMLSSICDKCNPIAYEEIEQILQQEYGTDLDNVFRFISKKPVGSASVSQVHRAILKSGEEVAIKIKRKDITRTIDDDIQKIRNIVHKFGKVVNVSNISGSDHALDLYLDWIRQETDFQHEKENIKIYQNFVDSVNGSVKGTKQIKVPKLYEEYCTDNVIVMEFIRSKTINKMQRANKMELTNQDKEKIITALNSYIKLSFGAILDGKPVVLHGDPHSGNVCIDDDGNICFLDMGLLCVLSSSEAKLCRDVFLAAYSENYEKLYNMLIVYGDMNEQKRKAFKLDCKKYCEEVKKKETTYYFIDLINICLKYEFVPPDVFFSMAKACICLNGIGNFSNNKCTAKELLQEQIVEFLIQRSLDDFKGIVVDSLHIAPRVLENALQYGLVNTMAKEIASNELEDITRSAEHFKEMIDLFRGPYRDVMHMESEYQKKKHW